MRKKGSIVFLGLETYSCPGGLQHFNRRLIQTICDRASGAGFVPPTIILRREDAIDMPTGMYARFRPCGNSITKLVSEAIMAARCAETIIVAHVNLLPIAVLCQMVAPRAHLIMVVHGDEVWGDANYRKRRPYDRALMRRIDRIVSVSNFTANRMSEAFELPRAMFTVFRNAVDPIDFSPPVSSSGPEFLSVTRLAAHDQGKHVDKVIRAFAKLAKIVPEAHYTVIGDGVLRPTLEALAGDLGVSDRITFAGQVDDQNLHCAYARASAFVLPSAKEGFGIVYLEAWQRFLPVICGTEDAAHEIVSDGVDGFTVHHEDVGALAERMEWIAGNFDRARSMGVAGNEKVQSRFLMSHYQTHFNEILDGL